ncbi:MAG: hypothetical protein ABSC94_24260 [Polyangiaceae bacterium]
MSRTPRKQDSQRAPDRPFELREVVDAEGSTAELLVVGERLFSDCVRHVDLAEMFRMLRLAREEVVAQLGRELVARFEQERARVNLSPPEPASSGGGDGDRLVSRYVTDGGAGVEAGIAWYDWYDISSRSVGPDHLPVLVRSRMRDAVHRKVTDTPSSTPRVLLGALDQLSS